MRKVWKFPLQLINNNQPLSNELFRKYRTAKENNARSRSLNDLKNRIKTNSSSKPSRRKVDTKIFVRDEYVAEYTKRIANANFVKRRLRLRIRRETLIWKAIILNGYLKVVAIVLITP